MAALHGLKILLLWAGIISLANCQARPSLSPPRTTTNSTLPSVPSLSVSSSPPRTITATAVMASDTSHNPARNTPTLNSEGHAINSTTMSATPPPPNNSHTPKTSNKTTDPQTITSPPNTTLTTVISPTKAAPPPTPQCDYTVTPIMYGLQFSITSSTTGNFTININEKGQPGKNVTHQHSNQVSSYEVKTLKPCTEYEHHVAFVDCAGKETPCNSAEDKTTTNGMKDGKYNDFKLSKLEPFTFYNCTGQIKKNNVTIKNKTTAIDFTIDCDPKIINTKTSSTNNSINLRWTTISENCGDVLPNLHKLSYDCSCSPLKHHGQTHSSVVQEHSCSISGLEPYTDYTCEVHPTYNRAKVGQPGKVTEKTAPGRPDDITELKVDHPEHNAIVVTCDGKRINFKGPMEGYIARLYDTSDPPKELKEQPNKTCMFEFRDLSYSTSYNVKVTAFNGHHESERPKSERVDTFYNERIAIARLYFFIIVFICGALAVVVYKIFILRRRKSMNEVSEDVMLQSTAIYDNVP